jgi:hypothetical protein
MKNAVLVGRLFEFSTLTPAIDGILDSLQAIIL